MRPPFLVIDIRYRKSALKSCLTALAAMQLQRTGTIDVAESGSETSSDSGTGSPTPSRSYF